VYLPNIDGRIFRKKEVRGKVQSRWEECRKFAADTDMKTAKVRPKFGGKSSRRPCPRNGPKLQIARKSTGKILKAQSH